MNVILASCSWIRILALVVVLGFVPGAWAAFPEKEIRLIVNSPPGGAADAVARLVGDGLARALGKPVIVDNRPGGGGTISASAVAKAAPDGYTLLLTSDAYLVNLSLIDKLSYRYEDLVPVVELTRGPSVIVAAQDAPFSSLPEMIELAKQQPRSIIYGSSGVGLPSHMAMELLQRDAGIEMTHAPYKGAGPALIDVGGGHVPVVASSLTAAMPLIGEGKVKALAVTSEERWESLPDVPAVAEYAMPGYRHLTWLGLVAPKGTPDDVIDLLNRETAKILHAPEVKEMLERQGSVPVGEPPAEFGKVLKDSYDTAAMLVSAAGLKPN